jgi:hypothetical protein
MISAVITGGCARGAPVSDVHGTMYRVVATASLAAGGYIWAGRGLHRSSVADDGMRGVQTAIVACQVCTKGKGQAW